MRRREVYVQGAGRWKDPDEDLPGDFEDNRDAPRIVGVKLSVLHGPSR